MKKKKYWNSKFGLKVLSYEPYNILLLIRMWLLVKFKFKFENKEQDKDDDLIFEDDFTYLNRDKWRTDTYFGLRFSPDNITKHNKAPINYWSDDNSYFNCDKSTIKMKVDNKPVDIHYIDWDGKDWGNFTIPVQSSMLDSSKSFMVKHGYFEARCKQPKSKNMWPAFWLASTYSWPPEIDIFEVWTSHKGFTTTIHWGHDSLGNRNCRGGWVPTPKLDEDFHIYGCEWNEKVIKVYFDNILVRVTPTPPDYIFPMQIILNNCADKLDKMNDATFPNYFEVDYVRVYKLNE